MKRGIAVWTATALCCGATFAAEDPPTPGGFRLRSEASTFAGPTADKTAGQDGGQGFPKPYSPPCTERENVFEFTEKPAVKNLGNDKYEITFAVKGNCDVAVGIVDSEGVVVRHLGAGVLGANAPAPFQPTTGGSASGGKISLKQTIYWNGKDDLDVYHKTPEKLRVRVMLGLKPEFDRRLGGKSPKNICGYVWGLIVGPEGGYVFTKGGIHNHVGARKYDHDGNYLASLVPPAANLPPEKLSGMGFIEYEPGVRAVHQPDLYEIASDGFVLPGVNGKGTASCRPARVGDRLFFSNAGSSGLAGNNPSLLFSIHEDGSTDVVGLQGLPLASGSHGHPRFAASPDGRRLYMVGLDGANVVLQRSSDGPEPAKPFVGDARKPGSDNQSLNSPLWLDCDPQGRVYVADNFNSRVQIFSAEGKHLKTIAADRPTQVEVHKKTGAVYVFHAARVEGQSVGRVTKFSPFDDLKEEFHVDGMAAAMVALDSWTPKPRLWLAGERYEYNTAGSFGHGPSVRIYEEDGKALKKIADFDEEAKQEAGPNYLGRWGHGKVVCDPTREQVYYAGSAVFDLRTGGLVRRVRLHGVIDDIVFDKRGYMHCHFNPGFYQQGAGRLDPGQPLLPSGRLKECPYDYGIEVTDGWTGVLPLKDQPGAKFFQDGIGVNMRGDIAVNSNIYHVPKMQDVGIEFACSGGIEAGKKGEWGRGVDRPKLERWVKDMEKQGEEVYFIRRRPGLPLAGATIWTFDRTGELRDECAAIMGGLINGVQIDEEGKLYFAANRTRLFNGKPFLADKGGWFGVPGKKTTPWNGSYLKTAGKGALLLDARASVPLEGPPQRPHDLGNNYGTGNAWMENAEWLYAGALPIVFNSCSCPTQRAHLDWYKRTYVPEAYRHSFGVLDTAGNLIMHLGRYGNFDSGDGANSKIPVGGDNIAVFQPRFVSGTDNYLAITDWDERLAVLKINYHAEESVGIGNQ